MIPGRGHRLLPAVSALLAVSAFPPFHLLIPSFVALVPLAVWVVDQNDGGDASGRVFRGGVWFGVLYFGLLLYWMPLALAAFTLVGRSRLPDRGHGVGAWRWVLHLGAPSSDPSRWNPSLVGASVDLDDTRVARAPTLREAWPFRGWGSERPSPATLNSWVRLSWLVHAGSLCGSLCSMG